MDCFNEKQIRFMGISSFYFSLSIHNSMMFDRRKVGYLQQHQIWEWVSSISKYKKISNYVRHL